MTDPRSRCLADLQTRKACRGGRGGDPSNIRGNSKRGSDCEERVCSSTLSDLIGVGILAPSHPKKETSRTAPTHFPIPLPRPTNGHCSLHGVVVRAIIVHATIILRKCSPKGADQHPSNSVLVTLSLWPADTSPQRCTRVDAAPKRGGGSMKNSQVNFFHQDLQVGSNIHRTPLTSERALPVRNQKGKDAKQKHGTHRIESVAWIAYVPMPHDVCMRHYSRVQRWYSWCVHSGFTDLLWVGRCLHLVRACVNDECFGG